MRVRHWLDYGPWNPLGTTHRATVSCYTTDHKPLIIILGDRKLEDIEKLKLLKLKEQMLRWKFDIMQDTCRKEATVALVNMLSPVQDTIDKMEASIEAVVAAQVPKTLSWQFQVAQPMLL